MKKKHLFLVPILGLTLTGCNFINPTIMELIDPLHIIHKNDDKTDDEKIKSISLNLESLEIEVGNTYPLTVVVDPVGFDFGNVSWRSENTSIATVNSNGVVTAINEGSTRIYAEIAGKSAFCNVVVTKHNEEIIHVSSVSLNKTSLTLFEGETEQLNETVLPADAFNKTVTWESSNPTVATVENGLVKAWSEGTATIKVTTADSSKDATCVVTVNKVAPITQEVTTTYTFNDAGYTKETSLNNVPIIVGDFTITYSQNGAKTEPKCIEYENVWSGRAYYGNKITIASKSAKMKKIELVLDPKRKDENDVEVNVGKFENNIWTGESKLVEITVLGTGGYKAISSFKITYEGIAEEDPDKVVNLGEMTIKEVKEYIANHPVNKNQYGNGVNEKRYVTIKGNAVAKIDTVKTSVSSGLDMTEAMKVIIADETGFIGCASKTGEGSLAYKVGDNVCKDQSKYEVTGYISEIQGNPELKVISYRWDQNMQTSWDPSTYTKGTTSIEDFYEEAASINYNCQGHGYGDVYTLKNLYCFNVEAKGSGKRFYHFTDGTRSIRVNAYNVGGASVGNYYDITGILSMKNYSPIIVAFDIKTNTQDQHFTFNYESVAVSITAANLNKLTPPQDDTFAKQTNTIKAFANIYKIEGYYTSVYQYNAISDKQCNDYASLESAIKQQDVVIFSNDNIYGDYSVSDGLEPAYFVLYQLHHSNSKGMWEGLMIPDFLETLKA